MKNLRKVCDGLPIEPVLHALREHPEMWDESTFRQDHPGTAHHSTLTILLRYCYPITAYSVFNMLEAYPFPAGYFLRHVIDPIFIAVDEHLKAEKMGRAMLVALASESKIDKHVDEGTYADFYDRFHVVLQSDKGNVFHCGNESVHMKPGECWWFNHKFPHFVVNDSKRPRIHLIVDCVAPTYRRRH